jgi:hypothetical protein
MLAMIAAAVIGSATPLPSVDDLVLRHKHAVGRFASTTAHWTGTITRGDGAEHFEVTADYTGRYRQSWTTPLGTYMEGCDGTNDWVADENGTVTTQPTQHQFSFEYALVRLNAFRLDSTTQATVSGPVDVDGRHAYALKLVEGDRSTTLYLDVQTALVDGADSGDHVVRYKTYKTFDGAPIPTSIEETAGGSKVTRTIDDVTFGVSVAGAFDAPAPREPAFPTGDDDVNTTFDSPHGLIVLQAKINDKPVRLLLDSGSSSSVIDADVAKNLQLPTAGTAQVQGAGLLSGTFARADKVDVAGITFTPLIMEAIPLKLPDTISHEKIDGVLGYDFLSHVVARIAYFTKQIQFIRPDTFKYSGTGAVLTADLSSRVPYVPASMGSGDKGTFTVDTGSDEGLVLYNDFASQHLRDFVDPMEMQQKSSGGVGGEFSTRAGVVTLFNLGIFQVTQVPAEIVLHASGAFSQGESDGLIGARVLGEFRAVFLDYRGKRLILEK